MLCVCLYYTRIQYEMGMDVGMDMGHGGRDELDSGVFCHRVFIVRYRYCTSSV